MASLSYERSKTIPLRNGKQIVDRVSDLVGAARSARLWVLLLNAEQLQLPQLVRVNTSTVADAEQIERGAAGLVGGVSSIADVHAAIVVLERPGGETFTTEDRVWARSIAKVCQTNNLGLAGLVVSHSRGVRWLAMDDFVA